MVALDASGDVGDTIGLAALPSTINVGSKAELIVTGGTAPYQFAIASGDGVVAGTTFIAPSGAGQSVVKVTDADGGTGTATITYAGSSLFVAGGFLGASVTASVLVSTDGGGTWAQVGSLPMPRANGAFVVYDDAMYYLGGLNASSVPSKEVYRSPDGATWTQVGMLPVATTGFTATVHRGEMWFVGGSTSNGNSGTPYHSADGSSWTAAPAAIAVVRHEHDVISRQGSLHVLGGHGDTAFLDDIVVTTDGSSWATSTSRLTFACDFPAAGELGTLVLRTCGSGCTTTETSTDLATWTPAAPLPDGARDGAVILGSGGRFILVGGAQSVQSTVDGSSWTAVGSLPASRSRTSAVQFTPP